MLPEISSSPVEPGQPLLTIAIPTFNRASDLTDLLSHLHPQILAHPEVELLISDNASSDSTPDVVRRFQQLGLPFTYTRHPENVGSDANFVSCFERARGRYFWLCGDDDVILPGALDTILPILAPGTLDLLYAASYSFRSDPIAERKNDPLGRDLHTFTDPVLYARVVNVMFTFISGIIVHRQRLLELSPALGIEPPSALLGTNLPQLSWSLPLLRAHRRSAVLWHRSVAGRQAVNGGYSLARVFGERLSELLLRLLPDQPRVRAEIINFTLRRWFPPIILDIRSSGNQRFNLEEAASILRNTFGRNPRLWIFIWPVLHLPIPLARLWNRVGVALSKGIYALTVPRFWRRRS